MSSTWTNLPGMPVKTSATWKGWERKRWILRARDVSYLLRERARRGGDDVLQALYRAASNDAAGMRNALADDRGDSTRWSNERIDRR